MSDTNSNSNSNSNSNNNNNNNGNGSGNIGEVVEYKKESVDYSERVMGDVPAPVWNYLPREELFDKDGKPNPETLKPHLFKEGRLHPDDAIELVNMAAQKFKTEPNLLELHDPITGENIFLRCFHVSMK